MSICIEGLCSPFHFGRGCEEQWKGPVDAKNFSIQQLVQTKFSNVKSMNEDSLLWKSLAHVEILIRTIILSECTQSRGLLVL